MNTEPTPAIVRASLERRLTRRLVPNGSCLEYIGTCSDRYGAIRSGATMIKAHRAAWLLAHGPIPDGMLVCHRCDNPPCCNVDHLFLGTVTDNNRDRHAKGHTKNLESGRAKRHAQLRAVTHCPAGHPYAGDNLRVRSSGARRCAACCRARDAARRAARRAS